METQQIVDFIEEVKNFLLQEGKENHPFKILYGKLKVEGGNFILKEDNHPSISFDFNSVLYPIDFKSLDEPVLFAVEDTFKAISDLVIKSIGHPTTMNEVERILHIPERKEEKPQIFFK
jgi:hypothetical protein